MAKIHRVAEELIDDTYNLGRSQPSPGEKSFLPLTDVRSVISRYSTDSEVVLLDYGCGGSPYRELFPNADYRRADYISIMGLDYQVAEDCSIQCDDATFDVVLSTQVLEHVREPALYLSEAYRVLKPGGRLILTTHGAFYDHGCPFDFRRWTTDGLSFDLKDAGFKPEETFKLTANSRALAFLLRNFSWQLRKSRRSFWGLKIAFFKWILETRAVSFDRWCDQVTKSESLVESEKDGFPLYIGICALASKPKRD